MNGRITMENRVDFLRERRALRDMIVSKQEDITRYMNALHDLTSERSLNPENPHFSDEFIEWADSVNEVCEHLHEAQADLEEYSDRLDEVNELLSEQTRRIASRYDS